MKEQKKIIYYIYIYICKTASDGGFGFCRELPRTLATADTTQEI